ncbi:MAG: hypothetical protein M3478_09895 [Planctomycetota bacterium]|nr:hypothetical protein [Planctomycetota bacterium]
MNKERDELSDGGHLAVQRILLAFFNRPTRALCDDFHRVGISSESMCKSSSSVSSGRIGNCTYCCNSTCAARMIHVSVSRQLNKRAKVQIDSSRRSAAIRACRRFSISVSTPLTGRDDRDDCDDNPRMISEEDKQPRAHRGEQHAAAHAHALRHRGGHPVGGNACFLPHDDEVADYAA